MPRWPDKTKPETKPETKPTASMSPEQYRLQMSGFQIGAYGGGMDERLQNDPYYKSGYGDGQNYRKRYSQSLKSRMASEVGVPPPVEEPRSNDQSERVT
jgi:hypothetical protein